MRFPIVTVLGLLALAALTPRDELKEQMRLRPKDPWPRGAGHVVLAWPGTREQDKAYHEPGGSFSPAAGSFGISIWAERGLTSDNIPEAEIRQSLLWPPGVFTETPYYQALWTSAKPGAWALTLTAGLSPRPTDLVVRSAGPAGGPVRSLDWDGTRLLINDRWTLAVTPPPARVLLGEEGGPGWIDDAAARPRWSSDAGWGWARLELGQAKPPIGPNLRPDVSPVYAWKLALTDSQAPAGISPSAVHALDLRLPEPRFEACANAQIAHLKMGLVDDQTRPGEPTNYPLAWLRDGAYTVVALARAGQIDTARRLTAYFAENDFFGGFGSEADAPGLAIWALEEVACRVKSADLDRSLWPHVQRKADFILELLSATAPVHRPFTGPIVPKHRNRPDLTLVADAARDGLIIGRMDHHQPLLFVNAVSYRGLLDAASLAQRTGHRPDAERWRAAAAALQDAWKRAFKPPESDNERTYVSGLWPSWIAAGRRGEVFEDFRRGLEARWAKLRDEQGGFRRTPLWTYFDVADAHQRLLLGQLERAWQTLRWFWDHQASPGLFTWWEGRGEENTFGRWEQVRGWVDPPYVTPHYWTAAEMLLLQLDMMAYVTPAGEIVIGAGVRPEWVSRPMSARGMLTPYGPLEWNWDGRRMRVKTHGKPAVRLSPAFPAGAAVEVDHP